LRFYTVASSEVEIECLDEFELIEKIGSAVFDELPQ
jgi:hypothetical protein